jgi:TP53 regulating kinase and related kinases
MADQPCANSIMDSEQGDSKPDDPLEERLVQEVSTKEEPRVFVPDVDWTLLRQGAEARLWKVPDFPGSEAYAICKERFPKKYRHPTLDARLTKQRCRMEARLLEKCRAQGIRVPKVLYVDTHFCNSTALIYLEYIDGITVRDYLEEDLLPRLAEEASNGNGESRDHTQLHDLAQCIGTTIAQLHTGGMVHGDLTTSNMMMMILNTTNDPISSKPSLVLIDFGLAKNTTATEERAVDLYVLERALQSTHPTLSESFLETLLSAYANGTPRHDTLTRLEKVRQRGRKRECFG